MTRSFIVVDDGAAKLAVDREIADSRGEPDVHRRTNLDIINGRRLVRKRS